jgi:uncharacterized protein YlxW (UPF0749 family)
VALLNMGSAGAESASHVRRLEDLLNSEQSKSKELAARVAELEDLLEANPCMY